MSWSKEHLSKGQREHIAAESYTVKETRGDEMHGLCPAHEDTTASFSYNPDKDTCFCLACGFKGDLVALWSHCNGYGDNTEGFKAFTAKYGETPLGAGRGRSTRGSGGAGVSSKKESTPEPTKTIAEADWQKLDPIDAAWRKRCKVEFGWSDDIIDRFDLRLRSGKETRLCIPIRQDDGALVNVRCYLPGSGDNKMISWGKGFGKAKMLPSPSSWGDDTLLLCEGEKDVLTALSHGFNACSSTGGCSSWPGDRFDRYFSGRDVVICYDNDEAGRKGAERVAAGIGQFAERVRVLNWPHYIDDKGDIADWFVRYGKSAEELRELILSSSTDVTPQKKKTDRSRTSRGDEIPEEVRRFFVGKQFKPRLVADEVLRERRVAHDPRTGQVFIWNGRMWEETHESSLRHIVLAMLGQEGKSQLVSDVVRIVSDLSIIKHGRAFNDTDNMLPLQNGMFDLERGELHKHNLDNLNTYCLDISLRLDPDDLPACPTFNKFMADFIPCERSRREVLKFAAYCMTRQVKHEKALFLIGPGGDGKSTFVSVMEMILGEINVSTVSLGALEDQFQRVMLKDKLLNVSTEIEGGLLQSAMFKAVVSGDRISASYKHRDGFSFKPVAKHIFAANKFPPIQDTSRGLLRRMIICETERKFQKPDKDLREKLQAELDGIFLTLVRHMQHLEADGGFLDEDIDHLVQSKARFAESNNPVISFANLYIDVVPGSETRTETMLVYENYVKFCSKRGYKAKSEQHFGKELKAAVPSIERKRGSEGKRRYYYQGIDVANVD